MRGKSILEIVEGFSLRLPKFPDGRIDYSLSDVAPIVTVFVRYRDKILLLKRSDKVGTYRGKWNTVAGYLDDAKPVREKALEELREEIGVREEDISSMRFGEMLEFQDERIGRTWIVNPVLVELKKKPEIKLDWEHIEYKWIKPDELKNFDVTFNLDKSLHALLK